MLIIDLTGYTLVVEQTHFQFARGAPYVGKLLTHLHGQVLAAQQLVVARLFLMRFVVAGQDYLLTMAYQLAHHLGDLLHPSLLSLQVKAQRIRPLLTYLE